MPDYKYKGKIYSEEQVLAVAEEEGLSLEDYTSKFGIEMVSEAEPEQAQIEDYFITVDDLKDNESNVARNLKPKLASVGLTIDEAGIGENIIIDSKKQKEAEQAGGGIMRSSIGDFISGELLGIGSIGVGANLSEEELQANVNAINQIIREKGDLSVVSEARKKYQKQYEDYTDYISSSENVYQNKQQAADEYLDNYFKSKDESRAQGDMIVDLTVDDFRDEKEYERYLKWQNGENYSDYTKQELGFYSKTKTNEEKNYRSAKYINDQDEETRDALLAITYDEQYKVSKVSKNLPENVNKLKQRVKDYEKNYEAYKANPSKEKYNELVKQQSLILNLQTDLQEAQQQIKDYVDTVPISIQNFSADHSRLSQFATMFKDQGYSVLYTLNELAKLTPNYEYSPLAQGAVSVGESIKSEVGTYQQTIGVDEIRDLDDAGRWVASSATTLIPSLTMAATGKFAMPLFFTSGFGSKSLDIDIQKKQAYKNIADLKKYLEENPDIDDLERKDIEQQIQEQNEVLQITDLQKYSSAALYGAAEVVFESLGTMRLLKGVKDGIKQLAPETIKEGAKFVGRKMAEGVFVEGGSEFLTTVAQNLIDIGVLGEDKNLFEDTLESFAQGALMGAGINSIVGYKGMKAAISSELQNKAELARQKEIIEKLKELTGIEFTNIPDASSLPSFPKEVQDLINELIQEGTEIQQNIIARIGYDLSLDDLNQVGEINRQIRKLVDRLAKASLNRNITSSQLQQIKQETTDQINKLENQKESILTNTAKQESSKKLARENKLNKDAQLGYQLYNQRMANESVFDIMSQWSKLSDDERKKYKDAAIEKLGKYAKQDDIDKEALRNYTNEKYKEKILASAENAIAFAEDQNLDLDVQILESPQAVIDAINESNMTDADKARAIKSVLKGSFEGVFDGTNKIIIDLNAAIRNKRIGIVSHEVLHAYATKIIGSDAKVSESGKKLLDYLAKKQKDLSVKVLDRLENYLDENGEPTDEYYKEVLNALSDVLSDGDRPNADTISAIKNFVNSILGKQLNFEKNSDVFQFVKDFNKKAHFGKKDLKREFKVGIKTPDEEDTSASFSFTQKRKQIEEMTSELVDMHIPMEIMSNISEKNKLILKRQLANFFEDVYNEEVEYSGDLDTSDIIYSMYIEDYVDSEIITIISDDKILESISEMIKELAIHSANLNKKNITRKKLILNIRNTIIAAKKLGFQYLPKVYKTTAAYRTALKKEGVDLNDFRTTIGLFMHDGKIFIDLEGSINSKMFTTPQHELLHAIFFAVVGHAEMQAELAKKVGFILEKENPKLFKAFVYNLRSRYDKSKYGVEYFTVLGDVMAENPELIEGDKGDTWLKKIGRIIRNLLVKFGLIKEDLFDFNDPKQVLSFMKEYTKTINSKDGLSDRAIASINAMYNPQMLSYAYKGMSEKETEELIRRLRQNIIDKALRFEPSSKASFSNTRLKLERELTNLEDLYDNFEIDQDDYDQKKENILYKIKLITAKEDEDKLNEKYQLSERDYKSQEYVEKLKDPNISRAEYEKTYALLLEEYDRLALKAIKFDTSKGDFDKTEVRDYLREFLPTIVEAYDQDSGNRFTTFVFAWIAPKAQQTYESVKLVSGKGYYDEAKVANSVDESNDVEVPKEKKSTRKIKPLDLLLDENFKQLYRSKIAARYEEFKSGVKVTKENAKYINSIYPDAKVGEVVKIDFDDLTFGNLIDLAPEVTAAFFGMPIEVYLDPKQNIDYADIIVDDENINKLSKDYPDIQVGMVIKSEAHMIQDAIIRMGADLLKIMPPSNVAPDKLPETDVKNEAGENFYDSFEYSLVRGTALKIPPALLKIMYEKTGKRSKGKSSQVKVMELKPMTHQQFLAFFGIFPTVTNGKKTYRREYNREIGQRLKGIASLYAKLATNTELRVMLRQKPTFENMVAEQNIEAGKSQAMFSESKKAEILSRQFNNILESKTGINAKKTYSSAAARAAGMDKGKRDFFIPPQSEDFVGLLYKFLDKGVKGERQMKWFRVNLIVPYATAMSFVDRDRAATARNYRALKKELAKEGFSRKDLKSKIPGMDFTLEQAIRVYIWTSAGLEVPGLTLKEARALRKHVRSNTALLDFAVKAATLVNGKVLGHGSNAEIVKPKNHWQTGNLTTDMLDNLNSGRRPIYLSAWKENVDAIFSEQNLNKIEAAYGRRFRDALVNMLERMRTGRNRKSYGSVDRQVNNWLDWINGSVGAIMFFNTRSALLQLLSFVNYLNWSDNNPIMAARAFANPKQYFADFAYIFNSEFLQSRRAGTRITIEGDEIARAAEDGGIRGIINYILQKGFLPTQIFDSVAISIGGAAFYRNRLNAYIKEGIPAKKAEEMAFLDFKELTEEAQQSSRPDRISQEQSGTLGRIILAFANTPAQYARLTKKALLDLKNGRGDVKTNITKLLYYGAVQNLMFSAIQNALFKFIFDEEDDDYGDKEEKIEEKTYRALNSSIDSFLRGIGVAGAVTATVKNMILKYIERSEENEPEFGKYLSMEVLKTSPPLASKMQKLISASNTWEWERGGEKMYEISLDNPSFKISAALLSATTNLPADRVLRKMTNLMHMTANDLSATERMMMALGWQAWELGLEPDDFTYGGVEQNAERTIKEMPNWQKRLLEQQRKYKEK